MTFVARLRVSRRRCRCLCRTLWAHFRADQSVYWFGSWNPSRRSISLAHTALLLPPRHRCNTFQKRREKRREGAGVFIFKISTLPYGSLTFAMLKVIKHVYFLTLICKSSFADCSNYTFVGEAKHRFFIRLACVQRHDMNY